MHTQLLHKHAFGECLDANTLGEIICLYRIHALCSLNNSCKVMFGTKKIDRDLDDMVSIRKMLFCHLEQRNMNLRFLWNSYDGLSRINCGGKPISDPKYCFHLFLAILLTLIPVACLALMLCGSGSFQILAGTVQFLETLFFGNVGSSHHGRIEI
jgi:hypothetical protein